jgi:hypothetical protein
MTSSFARSFSRNNRLPDAESDNVLLELGPSDPFAPAIFTKTEVAEQVQLATQFLPKPPISVDIPIAKECPL